MSSLPLTERIEQELLRDLNEIQREAVLHTEGPLLIIAGAGSGKTRVITHRIAYLCRVKGVRPYNIFAVTFTNKAAQEMRERLEHLMGPMARDVFVRTFHSLGLYILSRQADRIGLKSNFTVYDSQAQLSLLKQILKDMKIDADYMSPRSVAEAVNRARDSLVSPEDWKSDSFFSADLGPVYREYVKRLRANNALDFGDLLYESVRILMKHEDVLAHYRNLWRYCLIDEYQDTNYAQYVMGRLLSSESKNIAVVGDDDQAIYSWRGADVSNILNFEKDNPGCRILRLEENYRSRSPILQAASSVIANNDNRLEKTLYTRREGGTPVEYRNFSSDGEETAFVVSRIRSLRDRGRKLRDMAVFYRTNAQSRIFEQALMEANLPFVLVGSFRFYERREIKDVMAYLAVIVNTLDDMSLERIINVPARKVGDTSVARLRAFAEEKGTSLFTAMGACGEIARFRPTAVLGKLQENFLRWREMEERGETPSRIVESVLDLSGYVAALEKEHNAEAQARLDNLGQFIDSVAEYEESFAREIEERAKRLGGEIENDERRPGLKDYLQRTALYTSETDERTRSEDYLHLMTLHNAKGLEFPIVWITGLEEGYLPHSLSAEEEGGVEEERRLLYVGLTRAREEAYLTSSDFRRIFGQYQPRQPSRFLEEIDPASLKMNLSSPSSARSRSGHGYSGGGYSGGGYGRDSRGSRNARTGRSSRPGGSRSARNGERAPSSGTAAPEPGADVPEYRKGELVRHGRYGEGCVTATEDTVAGQKLSIRFQDSGDTKTFLAAYAPLERLGAG